VLIGALALAWDTFIDAFAGDLGGWEVTASAAEVEPEPVQKRYRVRVPLRPFGAHTTGPLTCYFARPGLRQDPSDSPAFTPPILAALGPL
jgi:hypothetical protein